MSSLAERLAGLSEAKRALLEQRRRERTDALRQAPLSFAQQRLWFLEQLDPGTASYNIPLALKLTGRLEVSALRAALNALVARHEILRTRFRLDHGAPVQVAGRGEGLPFSVVDLRAARAAARGAEIARVLAEEARRPFDLTRTPLFRVTLVRAADDDWLCLLVLHHIVADGWSLAILVRELAALYRAQVTGRLASLAPLPVQYADFARWQRQWLSGEVLDRHLAYWKQRLSGLNPLLQLPADRPRPALQTQNGAVHHFAVAAEVSQAIRQLAQSEGATTFMALLAVFKVLLARYTGETDICVGSPVAGRTRKETEGLIGFFVNMLVLRTDLSGNITFREALRRVRSAALGAYSHQEVPFELLVEALRPERSLSQSPLFQVTFALNNAPSVEHLVDVHCEIIEAHSGTSKFDLQLFAADGPAGFACAIEYNSDLFAPETIVRMAGHLQRLLESVAAAPVQPIAELSLFTADERRALVLKGNAPVMTGATLAGYAPIQRRIEAQAARTPERRAVIAGDRVLTYAELNGLANRIARHLQARGVSPGDAVGLCFERSWEMVAALLGIVKAGAGYVPLDPGYPPQRLAWMLETAGVPLVLTTQQLRTQLVSSGVRQIVSVDREWAAIMRHSAEDLGCEEQPADLAYIIYTSGSTGRPKRTAVHRGGFSNLLRWFVREFGVGADDRVLLVTSLSFDLTQKNIFAPLWVGGELHLAPSGPYDPREIGAQIARGEISLLNTTPSAFYPLLERVERLRSLRTVFLGGEPIAGAQLRDFVERSDGRVEVVNTYGPSECSDIAAFHRLRFPQDYGGAAIPIGRPISGAELCVLDERGELVPAGVTGELCIGGVGVGLGYLDDAEQTAAKFVPNPYSARASERLYRSGDLVRLRADGCIEFIGRVDHQVKLRGFRIELGEIEAVLSRQHGVRRAAVAVWGEHAADQRLAGYVELEPDARDSDRAARAETLRAALRAHLPDYMVPAALVFLDALPLSSNGKIDRKSLPPPDGARADLATGYVAPRTTTEQLVADVMADVLRVEKLGAHDDFFAAGGHSLLATQLVARLGEAVAVDLPLREVFLWPTAAGLAARIANARVSAAYAASPPIARASREQPLPLSFAQQRLWFLDQLEPGNPFYNVPAAVRIGGALDRAVLARSLNEIVRRHEALRTSFRALDGTPVQVIAPALMIALPVIDLQPLASAARDVEALRLVQDEAMRPFDLATGPVIRVSLIRLGEQDHILLLTVHHIVADEWSLGILTRELSALYGAYAQRLPAPLPELGVQYADFAQWQRQRLQGEVLERQVGYWKEQLAGAVALELPTDRPHPAVQTYRGATLHFTISAATMQGLRAFAQSTKATLFMTLAAAFNVLLYRYSGQTDICIGTPIANRNRAEIAPVIGFFLNTLVLRTKLTGAASFRALVEQLRRTALDAYAHQEMPFEQLVDELKVERHLSQTPLFQVLFVFQHAPQERLDSGGLELQALAVERRIAKFDLTLTLEEGAEGLFGTFEYNTDLFDRATIARAADHFRTLLAGCLADPASRIGDLPMLSAQERRQLLVEWNRTASGERDSQPIHRLFEAQVENAPDAVAVEFEHQRLSYGDLNAKADVLAARLRAVGVGPDVLVGLCVRRSLEMIIGVLGILKAGGAYVPLDPAYPQERLAYMLEDAKPRALLTQTDMRGQFLAIDTPIFCLDTGWEETADETAGTQESEPTCGSLAYVIYTSGSTGRPKGIGMCHAALVNLLKWQTAQATFAPRRRTLQFASLSFDVSFQEIFSTWCSGGTLVMVSEAVRQDMNLLARVLVEQRIDRLFLPFVALRHLAEVTQDRGQPLPPLQEIITAGEQLQITEPIRHWLRRMDGCTLHNQYGPSETHVVTAHCLPQPLDDGSQLPPIGRPIANSRIYVLDEHLHPVPVGVVGEVYIAGDGVARGYLHRPALTADKFLPDPYGGESGARMYRSGDLARYRPDANIEFLGRVDQQVKIRGFRVEPSEIEAVLAKVPAVREAVVLAREDTPGDRRLVAYLVLHPEQIEPAVPDLRATLQVSLPEYMVPTHFVFVARLPLTPSGKVDRKALPASDADSDEVGYVAPWTPTEAAVAAIWSEVLKVGRVGRHDDFFALGGHSLLATQALSRIASTFGVELPLHTLFEAPTLEELAQRIAASASDGSPAAAPIAPSVWNGPVPLSFAQLRLWLVEQLAPASGAYNIAAAVRLEGRLDEAALRRSLSTLVARHEALRTTFEVLEGEPRQVVWARLLVAMPVVDLEHLCEGRRQEEAQRLAQAESRTPFDLGRGPLLRVKLLRVASDERILLLTLHHIVSDGWSMSILVREIGALYQASLEGRPAALPPLPIQYADFAHWQRMRLQGAVLERELAYWHQQLAQAPVVLELPTDRPRPAVQGYRGSAVHFTLGLELLEGLQAVAQRLGATLFMTLLAGFVTLLSRYSRQEDIVIGSPIANRTRTELESLIGFFVNTLVLRVDVAGDPTFAEVVARVKRVTLDAYAHQEVPFEKLVEALQPSRNLSHAPLFQVMFVLQNAPVGALEIPALTMSALPVSSGMVKFDLTVALEETADGLVGTIEYATDLFDAATIERMVGHYRVLLAAAVAQPDQHIEQLPCLTAAERQQLLVDWNGTEAGYPEGCIHALFEAQAERTPEAVAVESGGEWLSYAELNARANQLAWRLRERRVGPGAVVGVCLARSLDLVVGLLGVLKAGAAYLPLDPAYPAERVAFMLRDARAALVLVHERWRERVQGGGVELFDMEAERAELARAVVGNLPARAGPRDLAYVIYTSGSTGQPKGVAIEHRSTVVLLHWARATFAAAARARMLASTSICFDLSVFELFVPLSWGDRVILVENALSVAGLSDRAGITFINTVPSAMGELVRMGALPGSVQVVALAGEPLQNALVRSIYQVGAQSVFNLYGPSEDTTYSTYVRLERGSEATVTIGRPIANTRLYILDRHGEPVPIGVPGELYIGGVGLARGYLHRAALTAERFVPDSYGQAGERRYRTGDLVRYRRDGQVEFLGRLDHQVKVRGYRIEPGEVEATLLKHPGVREAAVTVREGSEGEKRLIAHVVAAAPPAPQASELRQFLQQRLPSYMVPAAFVMLAELPLTPNGKIDRRALPAPDGAPVAGAKAYVAPASATEQAVAAIWQALLGVEKVGRNDNFFELGGDSLLAIQVLNRTAQAGLSLSYIQLFQHQTVAELAAAAAPRSVTAEQGLVTGPVLISPIQRWLLEQNLPELHHWNQAVLLEVRGGQEFPALLPSALEALLSHHDALRARFMRDASGWRQTLGDDTRPAFDWIDLSHLHGEDQWRQLEDIAERLQASLDLSAGPLIRIAYFDRGAAQSARLLIAVHHLVIDAVSWRILLEDLDRACRRLRAGELPALPPKTTAFQCWVQTLFEQIAQPAWQHELAQGHEFARTRVPVLPIDHACGDNTEASAEVVRVEFQLRGTVPARLNELLLAAVLHALAGWGRCNEVMVDVEGHGREDIAPGIDISRTVGWFTVIWPVRAHVRAGAEPAALLETVSEQLRAPLARRLARGLLRHLSSAGSSDRDSAAEVSFNYLGRLERTVPDGAPFAPAEESIGPVHGTNNVRPYLIDVSASIAGGRLHVAWTYSRNRHHRHAIQGLAGRFEVAVRELLDRDLQSTDVGRSPLSTIDLLPSESRCLVELQPSGHEAPFFCVHPAGGTVSCYAALARHLGTDQPFVGLQARGLTAEEQPDEAIETMAAHYVTEIRHRQAHGPYFLGGWSGGALVALEMAHRLRSTGEYVGLLALIDQGPIDKRERAPDEPSLLASTLAILGIAPEVLAEVGRTPAADVLARLHERGLLPPEVDVRLARRVLDVTASHYRAAWRYELPAYSGQLTLLRADQQPPQGPHQPDLGWHAHASGPIEVHRIPGNHQTILREPHVRAVAAALRACLERARTAVPHKPQ